MRHGNDIVGEQNDNLPALRSPDIACHNVRASNACLELIGATVNDSLMYTFEDTARLAVSTNHLPNVR